MSRLVFAGVIVIIVAVSAGVLLFSEIDEPKEESFEEKIVGLDIAEPEAPPEDKKTMIRIPTAEEKPEITSAYLSSYTIIDEEFGTEVIVVVADDTRTIKTNALPNHETGEFPNDGNPNEITAQNLTYTFPLTPTKTTSARSVREPGIAVNGIKFEPETAEEVVCESGEAYRIEAFQELADLGFDDNDAHVQPNGTYHYHGVPHELIASLNTENDLVHVGFARDGHLMYYSRGGSYTPSYQLSTKMRTGENCTYTIGDEEYEIDIASTTPDGTFVSDWQFIIDSGNLDRCNGVRLGTEYGYIITDTYPFIGRCLYGTFTEERKEPPQNEQKPPPPEGEDPPEDGPPPQL